VLYFKLLDDAAFFAVNSVVRDVFVLTVSFNIYLTRPVSAGELKASGRAAHGASSSRNRN
jgi:acyl-coenzyme A thioesterase PaaI-like protein